MSESIFQPSDRVHHPQHGVGTIMFISPPTAVVRFDGGIHECKLDTLMRQSGVAEVLKNSQFSPPIEVITRAQAAAIRSINDTWGIFSRSRILLLPHQIWVCHQVLRQWPTRYLVADEVGLGKTVEAGLILQSLISRETVKRLLILAPASLVGQWQQRLLDMFDIRLEIYNPNADTAKSDYWGGGNGDR